MKTIKNLMALIMCLMLAASSCGAVAQAEDAALAGQDAQPVLLRNTYVTWVGSAVGVTPVNFGGEVDTSALVYASSDDSVARVSGTSGCVIGVSEGTAVVTIAAPDGRSMEAKVIVYASRTDAEPFDHFYEYARAQRIAELTA